MSLKPIGQRCVIQRVEAEEKTASGIVLPSSAKEQPQFARVIAVGADLDKEEETKGLIHEGDRVIVSKYAGTEVKLDGEEYIIVKFEDILAVVED